MVTIGVTAMNNTTILEAVRKSHIMLNSPDKFTTVAKTYVEKVLAILEMHIQGQEKNALWMQQKVKLEYRLTKVNLIEESVVTDRLLIEKLKAEIEGFVANLLHYNRMDDKELPVGEIERSIYMGELDVFDVSTLFLTQLSKYTMTEEGLKETCY